MKIEKIYKCVRLIIMLEKNKKIESYKGLNG